MENNAKYTAVMVLSFMLGGFLMVTYLFMAYSMLWDTSNLALENQTEYPANWSRAGNNVAEASHTERFNRELPGMPPFIPRRALREQMGAIDILASPLMMFSLVGGLISIAAAISIRTLTHKKEIKKLKDDLTDLYLTDEEKKVMKQLEAASSEMTQRELTERMGFSRVKTHRLLQRLEAKKLIRKIPCGQTYKLLVEGKV
jgi:uncharacterized membrane protein